MYVFCLFVCTNAEIIDFAPGVMDYRIVGHVERQVCLGVVQTLP